LHDPVPGGKKIHPTEKPTSLIRQLIESSTAPGETVIDFCAGSGSLAEAAIQTGRNFLVCEKDPAFHAGIIDRLNNLKSQSGVGVEVPLPGSKYDPMAGSEEDEDYDDRS
jgi:DNA modification methylase